MRRTAFVLLAAVFACSDPASSDASTGGADFAPAPPAAAPPPARVMTEESRMKRESAAVQSVVTQPAPSTPRLIRTADLRIELGDVDRALAAVDSITRSLGGIVADSRTAQSDHGDQTASLVLNVPAARFGDAIAAMRGLGRIRHENVTTDDVSKEYFDLGLRITVKEETVVRLRGLLANRAARLIDVLEVERELARAVTELEQLKGELRYYDDKIAVSRISATLVEVKVPGGTAFTDPIRDAIRSSVKVLGASFAGVVYGVVFLLPWIAIAAAGYLIYRRISGRRPSQAPSA